MPSHVVFLSVHFDCKGVVRILFLHSLRNVKKLFCCCWVFFAPITRDLILPRGSMAGTARAMNCRNHAAVCETSMTNYGAQSYTKLQMGETLVEKASVCLSLSLSLSVCRPVCLPATQSVYLPVGLSACLPACLLACLSPSLASSVSLCFYLSVEKERERENEREGDRVYRRGNMI